MEHLLRIIEELNERFGAEFREQDKVAIQFLEDGLDEDAALNLAVRVSAPEDARATFDLKAREHVHDMVQASVNLYKRINSDPEFERALLDALFARYRERSGQIAGAAVANRPHASVSTHAGRESGWPLGFFERTFGSIPDHPEIESEGDYETRDEVR
ncbi:MAG: hypothetical protein HYX51_00235 [Chloroflexi bacterium]|nr:hypothetical protein [Chloroflexota bacterium]